MKFSYSILLAALSISSLIVPQKVQANLFRVNINETGGDVVFSFDGSIDLTNSSIDLNNGSPRNYAMRNLFNAGSAGPDIQFMGKDYEDLDGNGDDFDFSAHRYNFSPNSINVPAFGTNTNNVHGGSGYTVTGSGDFFRIYKNSVWVPTDFSSGDTVAGQMAFEDTTFSGLGITAGTFSYTLGNNTMEIVTTPAPGPLPILGLPVIFFYYRKLKNNS